MTNDDPAAPQPEEDPLLQELREYDQARAAAQEQLDTTTERLREKIVAVDRARPEEWGWRQQLVDTVTSLSRAKVFEALAVADMRDKIADALRAAEVAPALYRIGTGTAGQVVLALSTDHPHDDPAGLAERIRSCLLARELVIVPASRRKPTGSAQEQDEALPLLAEPGTGVAVIKAHRRTRSRAT